MKSYSLLILICSSFSGLLSTAGNIIYGLHYYDYHANELGLQDLHLGAVFYINCVSAGVVLIFALTYMSFNDTGLIKTIKKNIPCYKSDKGPENPKHKPKKAWQQNKTKAAPNIQKKEEQRTENQKTENQKTEHQKKENQKKDEKKKDNKKEQDKKTEVSIKTRRLSRFLPPIALIQTIRRFKQGMSRDDKERLVQNGRDETQKKAQKEKPKGLDVFAINVNNSTEENASEVRNSSNKQMNKQRAVTASAAIEAPVETSFSWDEKVDDKSQSKSEDKITVEGKSSASLTVDSFKYQKFGISKDSVKNKLKGTHLDDETWIENNGKRERPSLRRNVSAVEEGQEPKWARHTEDSPPANSFEYSSENANPSLEIYSIRSEPDPINPSISIDYEEVVEDGSQGDVKDIKPAVASTSTRFTPYS